MSLWTEIWLVISVLAAAIIGLLVWLAVVIDNMINDKNKKE